MSRQRRSREEWRQLVVELEKSGLPRQGFAASRGINWRSLENWRYRFRREQRGRAGTRRAAAAVEFVPVRLLGPRPATPEPSMTRERMTGDVIEARVGATHLRFLAGVDSAYVGQLLAALSRELAC